MAAAEGDSGAWRGRSAVRKSGSSTEAHRRLSRGVSRLGGEEAVWFCDRCASFTLLFRCCHPF